MSSRHQEQAEAAGAGGGAEDSSDEAGGAGGGPRGSSVGQMQNLMTACDDLGKAMESLVVSVVYDSDDEENDWFLLIYRFFVDFYHFEFFYPKRHTKSLVPYTNIRN